MRTNVLDYVHSVIPNIKERLFFPQTYEKTN